jgi:hypothetical protein
MQCDLTLVHRAEFLRSASPHLVAEVTLYGPEQGGRSTPILPGWGCPCQISKDQPAWDGWPLLGDQPLHPGEKRHLGFYFLSGDQAADAMRESGRFFLWEGHVIGEAFVVT